MITKKQLSFIEKELILEKAQNTPHSTIFINLGSITKI